MFKTKEDLRSHMISKLADVVPGFELDYKIELAWKILQMKSERGAIILGHNYMEPALFHSVCDFTGDSLELARRAAEVEEDIIIFCGVEFMAETAKILNPKKMVLLPAERAGCSLAQSITAADVRAIKEKYPGVPVVAYINTYADVKAEVDICVTSGNAVKVIESMDSDTIIFLPDEYLARNIAKETGKKIFVPSIQEVRAGSLPVVNGGIVGWEGKCEVHEQFTTSDIATVRRQFPDVVVLAHPECSPEVVDDADFSASTSKMINYVRENKNKRFLLLTECSMADNIASEIGDGGEMLRLCSVRCPHMGQITLENVMYTLHTLTKEIEVPEDIRVRAKTSIDRMLEY